jgi:hypothetical protein
MPRVNYQEGDWFAVPLRDGGFAVGVVAREPESCVAGYFFGPRCDELPTLNDVRDLRPHDAILVGKFGHLGLSQGKWSILGRLDIWDRAGWPMLVLVRYEELTGRSFHVYYDDDDPAKLLREEQIRPGIAEQGPGTG